MASCTFEIDDPDSTNTATYTTPSFTPAANDLLVVFVTATGTQDAAVVTDSQSGTYTLIVSPNFNTNASRLYAFVRDSAVPSTTGTTVTFDCTGDNATGAIVTVIAVAGMGVYGSSAIRQSASQANQAAGGTPAPVFASAALTGNPTLGAVGGNHTAAITEPSGWTEQSDTTYATPTTRQETVTRDSGFTGTTVTWGSAASGGTWASIIVELTAGEAHSGAAVITGGGTVIPTISKGGQGAATVTASGTVIPTITAAHSGSAVITGGGTAIPTISGSHGGSAAVTGGGTVIPTISKGAAVIVLITGGGTVIYTYTTGAGSEAHSGSAVITGGGVVIPTGRKGGQIAQVITGGGTVILAGAKQGYASVLITGGGIVFIEGGQGETNVPDFDAIAVALAGRFAAAQVTPPAGMQNIRVSTADLPNALEGLPCVLVFLDRGEFRTGNGTRRGGHDFTIRFYYRQIGDLPRDMVALRKWLTVLVDQLKASVQLGSTVTTARVDTWQIGQLTYAGQEYSGVELGANLQTSEAWAAIA